FDVLAPIENVWRDRSQHLAESKSSVNRKSYGKESEFLTKILEEIPPGRAGRTNRTSGLSEGAPSTLNPYGRFSRTKRRCAISWLLNTFPESIAICDSSVNATCSVVHSPGRRTGPAPAVPLGGVSVPVL